MRIYIAGPMRGLPEWNFPAFDEAERIWRNAGHTPFSPAQIDRALKYGPEEGEYPNHLRHVIQMDLACVLQSDAIALLPGWETSLGATVELSLAQFLGIQVYDAYRKDLIYPINRPWSLTGATPHAPEDTQRQHGLPNASGGYSHRGLPSSPHNLTER